MKKQPIRGYEDYIIYDNGQIFSLKTKKMLKPFFNGTYQQVVLFNNERNRGISLYLHKLVAENFIANPNALPSVRHKDYNRLNNRAENLEWTQTATAKRKIDKTKMRQISAKRGKKICKPTLIHDLKTKTYILAKSRNEAGLIIGTTATEVSRTMRMKTKYQNRYLITDLVI